MRKLFIAGIVILVGLLTTTHIIRGAPRQDVAPAAAAANGAKTVSLRELYEERAKAAREVVESLDKRVEAGEALTPTLIELQANAYERLAGAEAVAAGDKAGRVAAAGAFVERCEKMQKVVDSRFRAGLDVSRFQVSQMRYRVADARVKLGEAGQ